MGKFVVKDSGAGPRFNLLASNGQVIAVSQNYSSEDTCLNGIESVRSSCLGPVEDQTAENYEVLAAPKFEVYLDKGGEYRFRLKAANGQIVASSEGYKSLDSCLNGIKSVKSNAPDAEIVKEESKIEKPGVKKAADRGPIKQETK